MERAQSSWPLALVAIGLAIIGAGPPTDRDEDRQAIRATADAFARAFNEGDARAVAALFTEDGELIDEAGHAARGRPAIADRYAATFAASPGARVEVKIDALRLLGDDAAMEDGRAVVTTDGNAPEVVRYTAMHVKRDGRWLQASVREQPEKAAPHDRLKELEWLVGDWVDENPSAIVFTTCRWSEDGNFLIRDFKVQVQGKAALTGTQRIGWDPLARQIRSWVFDSEGGFGEGTWSRQGDRWVIKASGVLQDGRTASATQVITFVNRDMARWKTTDRTVGGRALADPAEVVIVRKPPAPSALRTASHPSPNPTQARVP